ncbi:MAG TPA: tetratricopeptide repeat protein, partial [Bacteroidia bacterium]|nr:tetratricopeptide repeat protein [Bacteroidia bacterium]
MKGLFRHTRKITLGLVLWGLFCAWANAAQTRPSFTDSLRQVVAVGKRDTNTVNAAKSLAFRLKYEDVDAAIAYGKQSLALAQELDFKRGIASAFLTLGQCYLATGEFDKSLELFRLGGIEGHKAGIKKSVFLAYMNSGVAYDLKGDYL